MNSNMYPITSYVWICLVYFSFFSKKYFFIMIIGDLYESPQNQLSIQICMKKIMLSILKHQILPFWSIFCLNYIRRQEKQISKIWFFQSIVFMVKCHHAKHKKKIRLAPQAILNFCPDLLNLLKKIWFCHLLKLIVKCPQAKIRKIHWVVLLRKIHVSLKDVGTP